MSTRDELAGVLNQWLNPEASEETTTEEKAPVSAVATESANTVEDASAAFDELFNK